MSLIRAQSFTDFTNSLGIAGVRDYIHVVDLAQAHVSALRHLDHPSEYKAYNIETGAGTSVLEILHAFEVVGRRA